MRLTADGRTESATLTVQRNPWIADVTDADLVAQYEFAREIQAKVAEANSAVIAIRRAKVQLRDRVHGDEEEEEGQMEGGLHEVVHPLMMKLNEVEANIYQVRNRSNQDPLNFPIKVNNRLANLLSMVERGDGAPNDGMREVFRIMVNELDGYTERLQQIWDIDLRAVNQELERLGMDAVDPWDEATKLEAPVG